jgi:hypothetical protein
MHRNRHLHRLIILLASFIVVLFGVATAPA